MTHLLGGDALKRSNRFAVVIELRVIVVLDHERAVTSRPVDQLPGALGAQPPAATGAPM